MTQDVSATFYVKIGGLGTSAGLYRFTSREAAAGDVPILLDVPGLLSSRMEPLKPFGSDEGITIRLAYETAEHAAKIRPLISDPSAARVATASGVVVQLTEAVGPSDSTLKLTGTAGLSTGLLYFLGGEAVTFSGFPDSTTATATRGVLAPFGGGQYHDAREELGPILTTALPTGAGQFVEFGRIVGGSETVLYRGRIREEQGARLVDGVAIELDCVSLSSVVRNAAISRPQGVITFDGLNLSAVNAANPVGYDGGYYVFTDGNGPASAFGASSAGYVHVIDTESGDYATFSFSGFGAATTVNGRPAKLILIDEGDSLAAIGNADGAQGLAYQVVYYGGGGAARPDEAPGAHYEFARSVVEDTPFLKRRVEIAISADDLPTLIERALYNPSPAALGLSAGIPSDAVTIPANVRSGLTGIRNTRPGGPQAFILPPGESEAAVIHDYGRITFATYRGRSRTLQKVLEGTCLKPFGLSLATHSDGTLALIDWTTMAVRFDTISLGSDDLADIRSEQAVTSGPTSPIIAVVPPKAKPLRRRGEAAAVGSAAPLYVVQSTRPITSAQIQAAETIQTRHAAGDVEQLTEIAQRMQSAADLYGLPRPEITATYLGGSAADSVEPGTFYTVSHPDVARSNGQRGLTNARAVCVEKSADSASGTVTLRSRILGQEDQEIATWAPAGIIASWTSPNATLTANVFTDADALQGPTTDAQAFDLDLPSAALLLDSTGAIRAGCTIDSRAGNVLALSGLKSVTPAAGDIITLANWNAAAGEWLGFSPTDNGGPPCYGADLLDELGTANNDAQRYR